jgi:hypothetical protein
MDLDVVVGTRPQRLRADLREAMQDNGTKIGHRGAFDLASTVLHDQLFAAHTNPRPACDNVKGLSSRVNRQEANRPERGIRREATFLGKARRRK